MGRLAVQVRLFGEVIEHKVIRVKKTVLLGDSPEAKVVFPGSPFLVTRSGEDLEVLGQNLSEGEELVVDADTFEISLQQFNEPLESVEFNLKMSSYIYVNSVGQWHDQDSFSKVDVKIGNCLWLELTYEVINRTLEGTCRRWQTIYSVICYPT